MDESEKNTNSQTVITITPGTFLKGALVLGFLYILFVIRDVVLLLLASVVIASAVEPATKWFIRHKIPRIPAVIFVYVLVIGIFTVMFYFLLPQLFREISLLARMFPEYLESIQLWEPVGAAIGQNADGVLDMEGFLSNLRTYTTETAGGMFQLMSTLFGGLLGFALVTVLSFYLAVQEKGVENFLKIITPLTNQRYVVNLWKRSQMKIGLWMQGQILLALLIGVLVYIGLAMLGMPNALLFAILAALFEVIPVFGPVLAAVVPILIGFSDSVALGFMVTGLYIIIQQFESHLIYPLVVRKVVGVSPIVVILALIVGGKLAGLLGLLLSVPVAAVLMEYMNDIAHEKRVYEDEGD